MTQLKLREDGKEKGTYTEESIAFGNALWDILTKYKTKKEAKTPESAKSPVEQSE